MIVPLSIPTGGSLGLGMATAGRAHDRNAIVPEIISMTCESDISKKQRNKLNHEKTPKEQQNPLEKTYLTISQIFTANLPTLVPPNFCTTQFPPSGRSFSMA